MDYNKLSPIKNKKAAIELSIGTVVIIVIAMTMLIMGIVLVRNIFGGATQSVNSLNDKVRSEIASLFTEEGEKIVIYGAGADRTIKIKRGTESFGFVISAIAEKTNTAAGSTATASTELQYKLELLNPTECNLRSYFNNPSSSTTTWSGTASGVTVTNTATPYREFDDFDNPQGDALILLNIPDDAETCSQRVRVTIEDKSGRTGTWSHPSKTFTIKIISGGFLG
jgi:hypothetical protein